MESNTHQLQEVVRILRNWKGSDPGDSPCAVAQEIDHVYAEYLASLPAKTLAMRRGQEKCERRAASNDSARILSTFDMFDQPTQLAPRPDEGPRVSRSPGVQTPAVIPGRGANFSGEESDDVPRLANGLVGLIVIVAACAMMLLAWRVHAL